MPSLSWIYDPAYGIGYIFLANLISSGVVLLLMIPELRGFRWRFNASLWREMLRYRYEMLFLCIVGIINPSFDQTTSPSLLPH